MECVVDWAAAPKTWEGPLVGQDALDARHVTSLLEFLSAMGDFSPMTTAPSGPSISGETQTTCVYHFDKFVKHSGVFGQEAVKERYLRYGLQNHFHNLLVQPFGSSSKAKVGKTSWE